ncbi:MAG: tetratricopeptide repeat protein [Sphingobacteriaceae bacterium]|nr:tetratricopeptide repeat protein [Sphingobacteriaceae bacterium]
MGKTLSLLAASLLLFTSVYADDHSKADTLSQSLKEKFLKPAKVGPENYYLPVLPVISPEEQKKLAIDERYKQKAVEAPGIKQYQATQLLANLLSNTGLYPAPVEQNANSLISLLNSFRYAEDLKNQVLVLNTLGVFYVRSGEPEKSIGYFLQSLQLMEQLKDRRSIAYLAHNLAGVFKLMGNYGQALTYYEYSQTTNRELKNYEEAASAYIDIATVKGLQKKYTEAEQIIFKKALPLSKWSKPNRMRSFSALAELYMAQKRYSEAKWYYLQESKVADFLNDQQTKIASLINIAQVKTTLGDQVQALNDYKEAERIASQNRYFSSLIEIKGNMGDIYLQQGDYASAGTAIDEYRKLKDSYFK